MNIDTRKPMRWIVRTDEPFRCAQSFLLDDGTIAYTKGLTVETYAADRGFPIRVVDDAELDALQAARLAGMVTAAAEETEDQYFYALEVLPPSKWRTARGVESFHVCERITGDLVSWHAQCGGRFFTFTDHDNLTAEQVAEKVAAAL